MQDQANATPEPKRAPWNKGKLTGAKPPLRPKHVWSIRTKLQIEGRARDLAMFNLAIDSKLRGCDVVAIRVEDVAAGGHTADRATVRQKKPVMPRRRCGNCLSIRLQGSQTRVNSRIWWKESRHSLFQQRSRFIRSGLMVCTVGRLSWRPQRWRKVRS